MLLLRGLKVKAGETWRRGTGWAFPGPKGGGYSKLEAQDREGVEVGKSLSRSQQSAAVRHPAQWQGRADEILKDNNSRLRG